MRIGIGYDIHRLLAGRRLILGGVHIPYKKGLKGHSDADVLVHAVIDAMLGAACLGDIGQHFPDSDIKYKGISSLILLDKVCLMLAEKRLRLHNLDTVIIAQEPKLNVFIPQMRAAVGQVVRISQSAISIKATTHEGVGPIGQKEAIAAYCVVLLEEIK